MLGCTPAALPAPSQTSATATRGLAPLTDGQVGEIVDVIDTQQMRAARLAMEHAVDPQVRAFAENLLRDQESASAALLARLAKESASLQPSLLVQLFEARSRDARAWLSNESGTTFDHDFLGYEVKEQAMQLDWLDHVLIPAAGDAAFRTSLKQRSASATARLRDAELLARRLPEPGPSSL